MYRAHHLNYNDLYDYLVYINGPATHGGKGIHLRGPTHHRIGEYEDLLDLFQQLLESSSVDLCFSEKKPYPYSPVQQKQQMISEKTRWILKTRFILEHQSQT